MRHTPENMGIDEKIYIPIAACPLCGSTDSKVMRSEPNKFPYKDREGEEFFAIYEKEPAFIRKCQKCDFAYLDRLPKEPKFFEKVYSIVSYDYEREFKYHGKKEIHQEMKRQLKRYCPSGTLLDIGTFCGTLLESMADTYSVVGCEISEAAGGYGRSLGLDIRMGSFDAVDFSPESFDIVTIIDVLEHLPQPKEVLEKIFKLLKPGGILYIKVPNGKAQIKKQNLLNFLKISNRGVAENFVHINHFSPKSLIKVINSLEGEVLEIGYTKAEIWDLNFPEPFEKKLKKWRSNMIKKMATTTASLISYISFLEVGFNIYAIAKKPERR